MNRAVFLLCLLLASCGEEPEIKVATPEISKIKVAASFSILADWVKQIGADRVEVMTLVDAGMDPHLFEPSATTMHQLSQARLSLCLGCGFDNWLDKLSVSALGRPAIAVGESCRLRGVSADGSSIYGTLGDLQNRKLEVDPHIWHDLDCAIDCCKSITEILCKEDPAGAEHYRRRAKIYLIQLADLQSWARMELESIPKGRRQLVSTHDCLSYLGDDLDLHVSGALLNSLSTEAAEPSLGQMAKMVAEVKASGAPAVFLEASSGSRLAEAFAKESGLRLSPPLLAESLAPPGMPGDNFLDLYRYNIRTIAAGLAP